MNTSIYLPDELADEFDEALLRKKYEDDDWDKNMSRSEGIRRLMREFIAEQGKNGSPLLDAMTAD